ncbi:MAG: phosphate ABC transporter permease PstA [Actinobacteria bacterium]|nr:phosphate ABC transporter permease PstA [Actinomycetota bacterium]
MARSEALTTSGAVAKNLRGQRIDVRGLLFEGALLLALLTSLLILLVLLYEVVAGGVSVLGERGGEFLQGRLSVVSAATAGVGQAILGSLMVSLIVIVFAFPLGIAAAVYLEEYAADTRFNRFITINIRNLAGVPSIVYGLLGLTIFVQLLGYFTGGKSVLAGGLTLAVLVLPIVIITSSEALRAVPDAIREAGIGVGATRWEVIRSHVLPSAAPGVLTGTILSLSRALGETAPLLIVGATTGFLAVGNVGFFDQFYGPYTTLPTVIFRWSSLPSGDFRSLTSAAIIVLLTLVLAANAIAIILRNRYEKKW